MMLRFVPSGSVLHVEVAATEAARAQGLQNRTDAASMLFVFPADTRQPFHNLNTLVPLDLAFVDASGRVFPVLTMPSVLQTGDVRAFYPVLPYRYAIEAPLGTLRRLGVQAGDTVSF